MENPEEILHSLEEFSKMKPKDIPRELEEYLCFVAKTGNPVYQWPVIKSLFREKLINVITEFYESCPSMDIPPCPNVEMFNYDMMKNFILEKLDTFAAAPFTVQRICELLTTPRKEYSRIDKYMRALEKNILVVSTVEPGRRSTENGEEGIMNGIESEHLPEMSNERNDINIEDMDETPSWNMPVEYKDGERESEDLLKNEVETTTESTQRFENEETKTVPEIPISSTTAEEAKVETQETVITCTNAEETIETYVSTEPQETYQNLSEESNSNSSDSSSSASASESKEITPEEKEVNEELTESKQEIIKPIEEESQDVDKTEPAVTKPEPVSKEISEDTQFELISSESEKQPQPEKESESISAEQITPDTPSPEVTVPTETVSEVEEKIVPEEKEAEPLEEKKEEEILEQPIVPEVQLSEPEEPDNVVDSSTDAKTEETPAEKSSEVVSHTENPETNDVTETLKNDIVETKEQYEESPMEVDSSQDKKIESEEPSSSVEPFIE